MKPRALTAALLTGLCAASCGEAPRSDSPDVLLISLDSVRADFLTFVDEETAPNLARLARRGTVFTQAVAGTSWTLPTHAQMFTGMPPVLHGLQESDLVLDPKLPTLPQLLRDAGYNTAGFYTCWYLASEYGFESGFDLYENAMQGGDQLSQALTKALEAEGAVADRRRNFRRQVPAHRDINSPLVVEQARAALERMGDGEPTFLFAHFFDPHFDYIPPAPYDEAFDPDYSGAMTGVDFWTNPGVFDATKSPARQISERDLDHVRALYRGEIAWTDRAIGELLDALEARGRLDDTLIIVTADHGEEFFEHEGRGHRQTLYDEVLRIPLLIVPPGSASASAPRMRDDLVGLSDLLPTALDYAGVALPPLVHGRSLRPALEGRELAERPVLSSLSLPLDGPRSGWALIESLRTPREKLIRYWAQFDDASEPQFVRLEYFDLAADPGERTPLTTLEERPVRQAWRALEEELDVVRASWAQRERTPTSELFTEMESVVGHDLAALGYVTTGEAGAAELEERARRIGIEPLPPARLSGPRGTPTAPR